MAAAHSFGRILHNINTSYVEFRYRLCYSECSRFQTRSCAEFINEQNLKWYVFSRLLWEAKWYPGGYSFVFSFFFHFVCLSVWVWNAMGRTLYTIWCDRFRMQWPVWKSYRRKQHSVGDNNLEIHSEWRVESPVSNEFANETTYSNSICISFWFSMATMPEFEDGKNKLN